MYSGLSDHVIENMLSLETSNIDCKKSQINQQHGKCNQYFFYVTFEYILCQINV